MAAHGGETDRFQEVEDSEFGRGQQGDVKILLVDDDVEDLDVTAFALRRNGFAVTEALGEAQALRQLGLEKPAAIVISLELAPSGDFEMIRRLRTLTDVPVLVTVARGNRDAALRAIDLGASDFITKPYSYDEIRLRLHLLVGRARGSARAPEVTLRIGEFSLDPGAYTAAHGAFEVRLTPTEFRICYALVRNAERIVPIARLSSFVGGAGSGATNSLRSHICHLRRKLALDGGRHGSITCVPSVGYVFRPPRERDIATAGPALLAPARGS